MIASCRQPERLRKHSSLPTELTRAPRGHSHSRCAEPSWAHSSDTAWSPTCRAHPGSEGPQPQPLSRAPMGPLSIPSTSAKSPPSAGWLAGSRAPGRRPSFLVPDSIPQLCDSQLSALRGCSPNPVPSSHIICWPFRIPLRSLSVPVFSRHFISLPLVTWFGILALLRAIPKFFPP